MRRKLLGIAVAFLSASCQTRETKPRAIGSASVTAVPSVTASAASAPAAAHALDLEISHVSADAAARRLTEAWNAALSAHDAAMLAKLYAPNVRLYKRDMTRERAIAEKVAALAASPGYVQQLSELSIAPAQDGSVVVTFFKDSGTPSKMARVRGQLTVAPRGQAYAIVVESDAPTEALTAEATNCLGAAMQAAQALPQVKKEFSAAPPDAVQGGVTYTEDGDDASAALGYMHDDRFEPVFFIDVVDGKLEVKHYGEVLPVSPAAVGKVKNACLAAAQ